MQTAWKLFPIFSSRFIDLTSFIFLFFDKKKNGFESQLSVLSFRSYLLLEINQMNNLFIEKQQINESEKKLENRDISIYKALQNVIKEEKKA